MSHKTEIKTELTDLQYMKLALDKLGFTYETNENGQSLKCDIMDGSKVDVELKITGTKNNRYNHNVGFRKDEDGTYTATGDFWHLKTEDGQNLTKELLNQEVTASSKEAELIDRLSKLDFETSRQEENGQFIELELTRWV